MQELSSSMIRRTIVPPSISTSGGSSRTAAPLLRFAGLAAFAGPKFEGEGRFSAAAMEAVFPNEAAKVARPGFTGCTEIGSCIGVEGFCTGVDPPDTDPNAPVCPVAAVVCPMAAVVCPVAAVVVVTGPTFIETTSPSPLLMPTSLTSLSHVSGAPKSTTLDG